MDLKIVQARISAADTIQYRIKQFLRAMGIHCDDSVVASTITFQSSEYGNEYMYVHLKILDKSNSGGISLGDLQRAFSSVKLTESAEGYSYVGKTPDFVFQDGMLYITLLFAVDQQAPSGVPKADDLPVARADQGGYKLAAQILDAIGGWIYDEMPAKHDKWQEYRLGIERSFLNGS